MSRAVFTMCTKSKTNTVPTATCSADPRRTPRVQSEWRPAIRPSVSKKEERSPRARDKQKVCAWTLKVTLGALGARALSRPRSGVRRVHSDAHAHAPYIRVVFSDYNNLPKQKHTAITHQHITQHKPTGDQDHVRKTHRARVHRIRISCQTSHTPDPRHKTRSACASIQPRAPLPVVESSRNL